MTTSTDLIRMCQIRENLEYYDQIGHCRSASSRELCRPLRMQNLKASRDTYFLLWPEIEMPRRCYLLLGGMRSFRISAERGMITFFVRRYTAKTLIDDDSIRWSMQHSCRREVIQVRMIMWWGLLASSCKQNTTSNTWQGFPWYFIMLLDHVLESFCP